MKRIKLLIIVVSLLLPIHSYACWDDDMDDDCLDGGELAEVDIFPDDEDWNDDSWGNDDDIWGGSLADVDIYPEQTEDPWFNEQDEGYNNDLDEPDEDYRPSVSNHKKGNTGASNSPNDNNDTSKNSKESLKQAAKKGVQVAIKQCGKIQAACNIGVNAAFKYLFGSNDLDGKKANQMVRYWMSTPSHWEKISMSNAQSLANQGYFVVAGWINPTGASGHVVMVVPGDAVYKPSWGGSIPNVMDTGSNKRSESQLINKSFGPNKKDNVVYFKYKK